MPVQQGFPKISWYREAIMNGVDYVSRGIGLLVRFTYHCIMINSFKIVQSRFKRKLEAQSTYHDIQLCYSLLLKARNHVLKKRSLISTIVESQEILFSEKQVSIGSLTYLLLVYTSGVRCFAKSSMLESLQMKNFCMVVVLGVKSHERI